MTFPKKAVLWRGAILGGITNAIMTLRYAPNMQLRGWFRNHYALKGGDGREGIITFAGGHWYPDAPLIGVFHDIHSVRYNNVNEMNLESFFDGCPKYQRDLADQEALDFLRLEYESKLLHRVTAAFWDQGESLAGSSDWDSELSNGVDLISIELVEDSEEALNRFQVDYGMSSEEVAFARSLFERKLARSPATITLTSLELKWLRSISQQEDGWEMAMKKFDELDIVGAT